MKERPILFSGPMVRAILDGRKTQTRRVVKPQPEYVKRSVAPQEERGDKKLHESPYLDSYCSERKTDINPRGMSSVWCWWDEYNRCGDSFKCPYGQPGDRLWVRETFTEGEGVIYRADWEVDCPDVKLDGLWKPSIFMPRRLCRIMLEIVSVRVERLNEISEEDAISEGIERWRSPLPDSLTHDYIMWRGYLANGKRPATDAYNRATHSYRSLWESINGPASWDTNPWVWVVEFKRVTQTPNSAGKP